MKLNIIITYEEKKLEKESNIFERNFKEWATKFINK